MSHPILTHHLGEPIPDLVEVPREEWAAALTPLTAVGRRMAIDSAGARGADFEALIETELTLPRAVSREERARRAVNGSPARPPAPAADRRARRQLCFRIDDDERADLEQAAGTLGITPATLARMLVHNGVKRMLYEERGGS